MALSSKFSFCRSIFRVVMSDSLDNRATSYTIFLSLIILPQDMINLQFVIYVIESEVFILRED